MSGAVPPSPSDSARRGLAKYRDTVASGKRRDIEKALRHLRKTGAHITVASVAARAGVSRKTVYKHKDIIAVIDQYRQYPSDPPTNGDSPNRESTIITALRSQLATKEADLRALRAQLSERDSTIAFLYGQLELRPENRHTDDCR